MELVYTAQNFLKNHKVQLRGPEGSIEGQRLVFDSMEVRSCVPRVPLNVLCCLKCNNMTDTAGFHVQCCHQHRLSVLCTDIGAFVKSAPISTDNRCKMCVAVRILLKNS